MEREPVDRREAHRSPMLVEMAGHAGETYRVVVVDDHPLIRRSVAMACEAHEGLEMVGEASDGAEALSLCAAVDPDVVLLDLFLPDMDGIEVIERLREAGARARILMISAGPGSKAVFAAMKAGAAGFVDKTSPQDEIAAMIEKVAHGESAFTTDQADQVVDEFGDFVRAYREGSRLRHSLTDREKEVLELIREGLITRSIAARLEISDRTVETHIKKLYRKLKVGSRVEAVMRAERFGLIPPRSGDERDAAT